MPSPEPPHRRRPEHHAEPPAAATVRLTVGLAHTIPGAELTIRRPDGTELVAANRPGADLNLCALRRLVIGIIGRSSTTADRWVDVVGVGGSVTGTAGGLWSTADHRPHRWFATLLRQERVIDLLAEIDTANTADTGDDDISIVLRPDPCLGITAVAVSAERPGFDAGLDADADAEVDAEVDELARRAQAACLTDELIWSARISAPESGRVAGPGDASPQSNKGDAT